MPRVYTVLDPPFLDLPEFHEHCEQCQLDQEMSSDAIGTASCGEKVRKSVAICTTQLTRISLALDKESKLYDASILLIRQIDSRSNRSSIAF